jgi:hypothetical protein
VTALQQINSSRITLIIEISSRSWQSQFSTFFTGHNPSSKKNCEMINLTKKEREEIYKREIKGRYKGREKGGEYERGWR